MLFFSIDCFAINDSLHITKTGIEFVKSFEGVRLKAYRDPNPVKRIWTIGYGHTAGVKQNQRITQLQADSILIADFVRFEENIKDKVTVILTWYEFDALCSFTFNVGENALKGNLLKAINANNKILVVKILNQYIHAGGKVLRGLVLRRKAEGLYFQGIKYKRK